MEIDDYNVSKKYNMFSNWNTHVDLRTKKHNWKTMFVYRVLGEKLVDFYFFCKTVSYEAMNAA